MERSKRKMKKIVLLLFGLLIPLLFILIPDPIPMVDEFFATITGIAMIWKGIKTPIKQLIE